ncbi:Protein of unknown function [Pseudobacteriovorax antillogorgiicola]|uniref:DUF3347 domain-containing protein n=2 Tax=Pseudobacteriovorax antillogorgiicola TaxID=1513793 RepID=A0A1Y6C480_9BACT|nr:uncharacterized protein DUF3347 [Pseudobacteriovorax antillogorgiicola]SMF40987.1 Protein of unknown function [Pseudobacteriovorax antillogorgiicola]
MKSRVRIFFSSALLAYTTAFAQNDHDHDHYLKKQSSATSAKNADRINLDPETKKYLLAALEINENLHTSFFDYNAGKVEKYAGELSLSLSQIKDPKISRKLQYSLQKLNDIKAQNDRKINNMSYHSVSMTLIHLIHTYNLGNTYKGYTCPMVKMKWVQNSKKMSKVHNPYAPEMKHCGSQES